MNYCIPIQDFIVGIKIELISDIILNRAWNKT